MAPKAVKARSKQSPSPSPKAKVAAKVATKAVAHPLASSNPSPGEEGPSGVVRRAELCLRQLLGEDDLGSGVPSSNSDITALGHAIFHARQLGDGAVDSALLNRAELRIAQASQGVALVTRSQSVATEEIDDRCTIQSDAENYSASDDELPMENDREHLRQQYINKLFDAVNEGDLDTALICLAEVPVDVEDDDGNTALSDAACYGEAALVTCLLSRAANPDSQNLLGRTPLWRACYNGHADIVSLLLEHGADKSLCNTSGEAPGKYGTHETKALISEWDPSRTKELRSARLLKMSSETVFGMGANVDRHNRSASESVDCERQTALLQDAEQIIFQCYDFDKDGVVSRTEFLAAAEQEARLCGKLFEERERNAALNWFRGIAEVIGNNPESLQATRDHFIRAKRVQLSQTSRLNPSSEAHLCWLSDLARRLRNQQIPEAEQVAPPWPIRIGLRDLDRALEEARKFKRVPLVVCNGLDQPERYFMYSTDTAIDAMEIINEVYVQKTCSVQGMHEKLKETLLISMDTHGRGLSLLIKMGKSACDFSKTFCCPAKFPQEIFGGASRWNDCELKNHFPDPMVVIQPEFQLIVTTTFSKGDAIKHLSTALPYFEEMAMIEIDKKSIR